MKNHVFIATTQKLVGIQSILIEDDDVPSVMCVDGGNQITGVSNQYYDFVKKGTGIIAKNFRSNAYRLDVSSNIDTGLSWQLPVYIAHHCFQNTNLGDGNLEDGDSITIASGIIKVNRTVQSVSGINEKIFSILEKIKSLAEESISINVVFPKQNEDEVNDALEKFGNPGLSAINIVFLDELSAIPEHIIGRKNSIPSNLDSRHQPFFSILGVLPYLVVGIAIICILSISTYHIYRSTIYSEKLIEIEEKEKGKEKGKDKEYQQPKEPLPKISLKVVRQDNSGKCLRSKEGDILVPDASRTIPELKNSSNICFLALTDEKKRDHPILLVNLQDGSLRSIDKLGSSWYIPTRKNEAYTHYAIGISKEKLASADISKLRERVKKISDKPISHGALDDIPAAVSKNMTFFFHRIAD